MPASSKKSTLLIVFLTVFLDLVGFGIIIPIQPFFAKTLGATPSTVTLLGASYSLMQFLFAAFWGRLSDRIGRRPVMLSSIAFACAGYVIFGFAQTLTILFLARMLSGFGSANIGAAQAIIADSTDSASRAKGMGIIGAAFGLGFIFGPALGGFLGQISLSTPAFVAAGLCFVNWLLAFFLLPETNTNRGQVQRSTHGGFSWEAFKTLGRHENVMRLFLLYFFFGTAFSMMEQTFGLFIEYAYAGKISDHAAGLKYAARLTSYFLIGVGVTATIVQGGLIGHLVKRFGEKRLLVIGLVLESVCFLFLPIVGTTKAFGWMMLVSVLMATGTGMINPTQASLLSRSVDRDEQGGALGLGQSLSALGRVFGPAAAGFLFELAPGLPFLTGGGLIAFCAAVAFGLISFERSAPVIA